MTLSVPRIRHYLQTFALEKMFIEELGWDHHSAGLTVQVDNQTYPLTAFAEKRGVQIFECRVDAEGNICVIDGIVDKGAIVHRPRTNSDVFAADKTRVYDSIVCMR